MLVSLCVYVVVSILRHNSVTEQKTTTHMQGVLFFSCFDGHGPGGTECALFARNRLPIFFRRLLDITDDVPCALAAACVHTNAEMHEMPKKECDTRVSGTTVAACLVPCSIQCFSCGISFASHYFVLLTARRP